MGIGAKTNFLIFLLLVLFNSTESKAQCSTTANTQNWTTLIWTGCTAQAIPTIEGNTYSGNYTIGGLGGSEILTLDISIFIDGSLTLNGNGNSSPAVLRIPSGKTLIINGGLSIANKVKILVESGASLVVTGQISGGTNDVFEGSGFIQANGISTQPGTECGPTGCPTIVTWNCSIGGNSNFCSTNTTTPPCSGNMGYITGGGISQCSQSTGATLTLNQFSGTVTKWQKSVSPFSTWTDIPNSNNSSYTFSPLTQTTRFRAVVINGNCTSNSIYTTITYSSQMAVGTPTPIAGISERCRTNASTTGFSTSASNASRYVWSVSAGNSTITGSGTTGTVSWDANFSGTATISVYAVNDCGNSSTIQKQVRVDYGNPQVYGINGNSPVCAGSVVSYSANGNYGVTYNWSLQNAGSSVINGSGSSITVSWDPNLSGTASIRLSLTNACATSAVFSRSITINRSVSPNVTISSNAASQVCLGASVTFNAALASASAGTYQWKINGVDASNGSQLIRSDLVNGDIVRCEFTSNSTCATTTVSNSITMNISSSNTWTGNGGTNWSTPSSWSCGILPTANHDVIIPSGTSFNPVISGTANTKNLTIQSGASLTFNSGAIGNFTGNAIVNGQWLENGPATVTVGGSFSFSNTIESVSSITINGNLSFPSNGKIKMNANSKLTLGADATYSGASETSFVEGWMGKVMNSTNKFIFPIGDNTTYRRAGITPETSTLTTYSARFYKSNPNISPGPGSNKATNNPSDPDYIYKISDVEYWLLEKNVISAKAKVTLFWGMDSYVNENGDFLQELRIGHYDNVKGWEGFATNLGNETANTRELGSIVTADYISSFSPFVHATKTVAHPLPVSLSEFTLSGLTNGVGLIWKTTSETNNSGYEIQRSTDGFATFEKVAFIEGKGTTTAISTYAYNDYNVFGDIVFYRLKQIDSNGLHKYSEIKYIKLDEEKATSSIYPNPTKGEVLVVAKDLDKEENLQVSIIGTDGSVRFSVKNLKGSQLNETLSNRISGLNNGTYTILLTTSKTRYSFRVIKI